MSTNRKILKVLSIISLIFSILGAILGGLIVFACCADPDGALKAVTVSPIGSLTNSESLALLLGAGVALIIYFIWEFFVSLMGIRGANNPRKMGFVTIVATISAVIGVIGFVLSVTSNGAIVSSLTTAVFNCAFLYVCYKVREEGKNSQML